MGDDAKQVVVMRTDLGMGRGKMAAQSGHACVMGADRVKRTHPGWYDAWWAGGQKKVALKVPGLDELLRIRAAAAAAGLPYQVVSDAGHTQLDPGTVTCMSIGPAPESAIDKITGDLKLL